MTRRFDNAWREALGVARQIAGDGFDVVVVRDLLGRASVVVVDDTDRPYPPDGAARVADILRMQCAPFVAEQPLLAAKDLFTPESLTSAPDLLVVHERDCDTGRGQLAVLDRGVVGREWLRLSDNPVPNHVTLYGFKGGVGRSTATAVLAQHLAGRGSCVLAVDLDLESPGMSAIALNAEEMPDYGIVDYLVEVGVGNAHGLDCVGRSSRLWVPGNGEVWVAPAGGRPRDQYSYLPKLNRAYIDYPVPRTLDTGASGSITGQQTFAWRLRAAVDYCVDEVRRRSRKPDVVLLDSRAGIHDVAAVAMTQLSDLSLLFGVDNAQTWNGYRELFQEWRRDPELTRAVRERLRMVAAMVPAATEAEYLSMFRDRAQLMFSELLYDEARPEDPEAFNPPLTDRDAPHSPLPILFSTDLVGVDVTGHTTDWLNQDLVGAAFGPFVRSVADLVLPDTGGGS